VAFFVFNLTAYLKMTRLDLHEVFKTYGAIPILTHICFKIEDGDKVGIIGENGSGKSTLLKLITE
jgi:ABC-type polysaccharide/polyol phosphate transport system ATPase subunit